MSAKTKQYETTFDDFYRNEWRHNSQLSSSDLLLAGYPFTVEIDLAPGDIWLELGVGSGRVVDFHKDKLSHGTCVGVDRSITAIRQLKQNLPIRIDALVADIRNLPFKKKAFNLITLFGTIQVFPKAKWFDAIDKVMPLLAPNGRLGFSVHPVSPLELIRGINNPTDYMQLATESFLGKQLAEHGYGARFSVERHRVYVILQKLTSLFGVKLENWYGFTEYRNTEQNRNRLATFDKLLPWLSFGHFWIWIKEQ